MTVAKKEERNKRQRHQRAKKTKEMRKPKIKCAKGRLSNEDVWLTIPDFAIGKAKTDSDGKFRDSDGRHYLLKTDKQCQFCGAMGFESEVQGENKNPKNPTEKLVHFGLFLL